MISLFVFSYFIAAIFILTLSYNAQVVSSSVSCIDYGYNPTTLSCSTCDIVGQILGEQSEAKSKCKECCINISPTTEEKYRKAVLEVDKRSISYFPDIQAVIDKKKELKISIRYSFGSPRLLMYKNTDDDEPTETLSVYSWTKDTFQDYLSNNLITSSKK